MGKMAKNKGANGEREVVKLLQPIVNEVYEKLGKEPPELKRNLEQTRNGGYDLVGVDWMALEVKRQEQLQINQWWKQTVRQCRPGQMPVLIFRQNRQRWRVMVRGGIKMEVGKWMPVRSEIKIEDFLLYFRRRLEADACGQ